jgi:hypothetical protein
VCAAAALQIAVTAAAAPHSSKQPAMHSQINKLLLLSLTTLLHLASASYSMLRSIATARQRLDTCLADTVGPMFDFSKLNDECNALVAEQHCFNNSRADNMGLPHLHIRLPAAAAAAAAAAAEALLAPGTPTQDCCNSRRGF